jgi:hypothetical protein
MKCIMPTRNLRACKRDVRFLYLKGGGSEAGPLRDGERTVAGYCAQHDATKGGRHLRPYPWEYDRKLDTMPAARRA